MHPSLFLLSYHVVHGGAFVAASECAVFWLARMPLFRLLLLFRGENIQRPQTRRENFSLFHLENRTTTGEKSSVWAWCPLVVAACEVFQHLNGP